MLNFIFMVDKNYFSSKINIWKKKYYLIILFYDNNNNNLCNDWMIYM